MTASLSTLRSRYRSHMERSQLGPSHFRSRCRVWLSMRGWVNMSRPDSEVKPDQWVTAADAVADDEEWEREQEEYGLELDDGYMGTGMSEAQYYRAAGSAEFDY